MVNAKGLERLEKRVLHDFEMIDKLNEIWKLHDCLTEEQLQMYIEFLSRLHDIDITLNCFGYKIDYTSRKIVKEEQ